MLSLLFASVVFQELVQDPGSFVRTINRADGVSVSQTATFKLVAPGKPDLWLVGVAHIGEKQYYADIQSELDKQDVVLFEGVRSKVAKQPKVDPKAPKPVYQVLSDAIGLDFQLVDIHYDRQHWINSDLSMDQLDAINKKNSKGKPNAFNMIEQILDPNSAQAKMTTQMLASLPPSGKVALKIFLVEKLAKIDTLLAAEADPDTIKLILSDRNKSVENVYEKVLSGPQPPRSVAIFYGAAHMPELKAAFAAKYGYKLASQSWFTFAKVDRHKLDAAGQQFLNILEMASKSQGG